MAKKGKNPIHGVARKAFYEKSWLTEIFTSAVGFVGSAVAIYKTVEGQPPDTPLSGLFWVLSVALILYILVSILKILAAYKKDKREDESRSHEGLVGALHVIHGLVCVVGNLDANKASGLRVTFHRVVPHNNSLDDAEQLEQIVDYVGGKYNGAGRKISLRSGITGDAFRNKAVFAMERTSESFENYVQELVSAWNYLPGEASKMTSTVFSAVAVPIKSKGGDVVGVLYMDSVERKFFSSAVLDLVLDASGGITNYIGERYE